MLRGFITNLPGRLLSALIFGMIISSPAVSDILESPFCSIPADPAMPWLPITPLPHESSIPAPRGTSDCQFYRPAWQRFLVATQPTAGGIPAFLHYPSFSEIFAIPATTPMQRLGQEAFHLDLLLRGVQRPNNPTQSVQNLLDDTQAGVQGQQGGYLIDQHGRFVYYAIHVNPEFLQFLKNQNLTTLAGIEVLSDPNNQTLPIDKDPRQLTFLGADSDIKTGYNTNVVEYKSAWMIVDGKHPPSNYFVVPASVPHYVIKNDALVQEIVDGKPVFDPVKVALLALHVVFTLPGHPEMIWSTFEHVGMKDGILVRDNAPDAKDNPTPASLDKPVSMDNFPLYKAGTLAKDSNQPFKDADFKANLQYWDSQSQSFTKGKTVQTSVYRPYPGSKTDGSAKNPDHGEDSEVIAVNNHVSEMFKEAKAKGLIEDSDQRRNYRLVGAIWLDQPILGNHTFKCGASFAINENQSTDDDDQAIAGEGRLGSTAMESFTEFDGGAPNCFSCHDADVVVHNGKVLIGRARLNVSHVLSKYVSSQNGSATVTKCQN
jgi:hypothetical protein